MCNKAVPKVIRNFKNPIKSGNSIRNILFTICVVRVWIRTWYLLFEEHPLLGFLKVIGIQMIFKHMKVKLYSNWKNKKVN